MNAPVYTSIFLLLGVSFPWVQTKAQGEEAGSRVVAVSQQAVAGSVEKVGAFCFSVGSLDGNTADYEQANREARSLLDASVLLFDPATEEPMEALWRERLASQGLPSVALSPVGKCQAGSKELELLYRTYEGLIRIFPEQRSELDGNLQDEVCRWRRGLRSVVLGSPWAPRLGVNLAQRP